MTEFERMPIRTLVSKVNLTNVLMKKIYGD